MTQPTPQPRTAAPSSRDIVIGATVYGRDNARFGSVAGSYRNYLIVERGFFMPVDYYVPMTAIERADRDLVILAVSRDAALSQGWERPPFTSETGQRGLRRPAVGRPPAAAAPGASAAARTRQPGAPSGTNPNGWPAPAGATAVAPSTAGVQSASTPPASSGHAAAEADITTGRPGGDASAALPKEGTAISPAAAFADTYAVGTNTDSYHAMTDFAPPKPTLADIPSSASPSPEPVSAEQGDGTPDPSRAASSAAGTDATESGSSTPPGRPTT